MADGWVKIYRQSIDRGWLKNPELWTFWSWCLLKASHNALSQLVGYQQVDLEPGQFIFGRKAAAEELETTERKIRTCIETLKKLKNVTIKTTNKFSIITITNWDRYQDNGTQNDQQNDQQPANNLPTTCHKQEVKKLRIKEKTPYAHFDEFWEAYPRKVSKDAAMRSWKKINPDENLAKEIIESVVNNSKNNDQWIKDDGKYIPYPATWLNGKRWEDSLKVDIGPPSTPYYRRLDSPRFKDA